MKKHERDIAKKEMEKNPSYKIEARCEYGRVDLLSSEEIVEIKYFSKWKHAIGQLLVYNIAFPGRKLKMLLFGKKAGISFGLRNAIEYAVSTFDNLSVEWHTSCVFSDKVYCEFGDLSGKKFGRLTAVKRDGKKSKWICECSCDSGKAISVSPRNLIEGITVSCGCVDKKKKETVILGTKYESITDAAKALNMDMHTLRKRLKRFEAGEIAEKDILAEVHNRKTCWDYGTKVGENFTSIGEDVENRFRVVLRCDVCGSIKSYDKSYARRLRYKPDSSCKKCKINSAYIISDSGVICTVSDLASIIGFSNKKIYQRLKLIRRSEKNNCSTLRDAMWHLIKQLGVKIA